MRGAFGLAALLLVTSPAAGSERRYCEAEGWSRCSEGQCTTGRPDRLLQYQLDAGSVVQCSGGTCRRFRVTASADGLSAGTVMTLRNETPGFPSEGVTTFGIGGGSGPAPFALVFHGGGSVLTFYGMCVRR